MLIFVKKNHKQLIIFKIYFIFLELLNVICFKNYNSIVIGFH